MQPCNFNNFNFFFIHTNSYYEHNIIRKRSLQISKLSTVEILAVAAEGKME